MHDLTKIKLIVCDVDGVVSRQDVFYENGEHVGCSFSVKDGSAISLSIHNGIPVAWISGRESESVKSRAKSVGVCDLYMGNINKTNALNSLCNKYYITMKEICFITDDFYDIPALEMVGFPCAVADAVDEVKEMCCYCSSRKGGEGAVAEIIRLILIAKFGKSVFKDFAYALWSK